MNTNRDDEQTQSSSDSEATPSRVGRRVKEDSAKSKTTPTRTTAHGRRGTNLATRKRLFDSDTTEQVHTTARDRFTRSSRRGKSKNTSVTKRSRKQKVILEPLPYDAQKSSAEVADPLLLSPNSKKAYESNKRLPMKLRGKGTHGNILKKVTVQVLEGSPTSEHTEQIQNIGQQFSRILTTQAKKFCVYEWFYPTIEQSFWERNDFTNALHELKLDYALQRIPRYQLSAIRTKIANNYKIRRFSKAFLQGELELLRRYRESVRAYHNGNQSIEDEEVLKAFDYISVKLTEGDRVYILDTETNHVYPGTILAVGASTYHVNFDDDNLSDRMVPDIHVMALDSVNTIPVGKRSFSVMSANSTGYGSSPKTPPAKRQKLTSLNDSTNSPTIIPSPQYLLASPIPSSSPQRIQSPEPNFPQISGVQPPIPSVYPTGIPLTMADYIMKLTYKQALVNELRRINTESKMILEKGIESLPHVLCQRCAYVVLKLKEVNHELDRIPLVLQQQIAEVKEQHFGGSERYSGISSTQHLSNLFQDNRRKAAELVADYSRQIIQDIMNSNDPPQLPSSSASLFSGSTHQPLAVVSMIEKFDGFQKRVQGKISDCIAFLLHLRSCVRDQTMTNQEIELTLDAAAMALKSDAPETSMVYRDIKQLVDKLKQSIANNRSSN